MEDIYSEINKIVQHQTKEIDDLLQTYARNFSNPPIKGEITTGKVKWRGLKMCVKNNHDFSKEYWIEQRGVKISPVITVSGKIY